MTTAFKIPVQSITAPKRPRRQSGSHLDFIRSLPCCVCGDNTSTEAAHIRFADRSVGKRETGLGEKAADFFCVPLCGRHHRDQHAHGNERIWWAVHNRDPIRIALALWAHTGQHEVGEQIVRAR